MKRINTVEEEKDGALKVVFENGVMLTPYDNSLESMRARIAM